MKEAHIYIYGDIGYWQAADAAEWGEVTLTDVRNQYEAQKNAEKIVVHIHSPGGYVTEGFAIHDYLRSLGKPITTIVEGMCYSIATVIALAGDVRKMTSNSDFMIHNPWGGASGESDEIQKYADDLRKTEKKAADFYAAKTNITSDEALQLMKAETFMTAEEALSKGFITEIATVMKAVAKFNPNKNRQMSKNNLTKEEAQGMFSKFEEKMKNLFGNKPKAKLVQDANGTEIDFTELEEDDTPSVGDKATIDGSAAEGEHVMPSGETFVFEGGELTEIKPSEEEDEENEEVENLKTEVQNLKEQLKTSKAAKKAAETKLSENETAIQDLQKEFKKMKKEIGSSFNHDPKKKNFNEGGKTRSVWKEKE